MDDLDQQVAANMKRERKLAGLSQEEVARRLGVSLRSYARWERGEGSGHVGRVNDIAKALGVKPEELVPEPEGDRIDVLRALVAELTAEVHALRERLDPESAPKPSRRRRTTRA